MLIGKCRTFPSNWNPASVRTDCNHSLCWNIGSEGSKQSSVGTSYNCKLADWKVGRRCCLGA